jgi:hypothetical protein
VGVPDYGLGSNSRDAYQGSQKRSLNFHQFIMETHKLKVVPKLWDNTMVTGNMAANETKVL